MSSRSNYEQLGLKFRLFSAEVLYNKGLSLIYMGRVQEGLQDLQEASRDKAIDDHKVIDEAIRDRGEGYMVFSVVCHHHLLCRHITDHRAEARWCALPPFRKETQERSSKRFLGETRKTVYIGAVK